MICKTKDKPCKFIVYKINLLLFDLNYTSFVTARFWEQNLYLIKNPHWNMKLLFKLIRRND